MSFIRKATRSVRARPSCPIFELWRPENRTVGSRTCRDYCECRCCDYRISTLSNDAQSNAAFYPCLSIKILSKPGIRLRSARFLFGPSLVRGSRLCDAHGRRARHRATGTVRFSAYSGLGSSDRADAEKLFPLYLLFALSPRRPRDQPYANRQCLSNKQARECQV